MRENNWELEASIKLCNVRDRTNCFREEPAIFGCQTVVSFLLGPVNDQRLFILVKGFVWFCEMKRRAGSLLVFLIIEPFVIRNEFLTGKKNFWTRNAWSACVRAIWLGSGWLLRFWTETSGDFLQVEKIKDCLLITISSASSIRLMR